MLIFKTDFIFVPVVDNGPVFLVVSKTSVDIGNGKLAGETPPCSTADQLYRLGSKHIDFMSQETYGYTPHKTVPCGTWCVTVQHIINICA